MHQKRIPMNTQQMYEYVVNHLVTQTKQCVGSDGGCMYRGLDDMKCAVGCLIADEFYEEELENCAIDEPNVRHAVELSINRPLSEEELALLLMFQSHHDEKSFFNDEMFPDDYRDFTNI